MTGETSDLYGTNYYSELSKSLNRQLLWYQNVMGFLVCGKKVEIVVRTRVRA